MALTAARTLRLHPPRLHPRRHPLRRAPNQPLRRASSTPPRNPILSLRTPAPASAPRPAWSALSAAGKAARATEQTFNLGLVALGLGLTGTVGYFLWTAVLAPDGPTAAFNRAADEVRGDARAQALLGADAGVAGGGARAIRAYGEPTRSRWARNRPVAAHVRPTGRGAAEEMVLRFYVEGPAAKGTVRARLVRASPSEPFEYDTLTLDVPGAKRLYLRNTEPPAEAKKRSLSFLGIKWK